MRWLWTPMKVLKRSIWKILRSRRFYEDCYYR
jgi:hypothetical protein